MRRTTITVGASLTLSLLIGCGEDEGLVRPVADASTPGDGSPSALDAGIDVHQENLLVAYAEGLDAPLVPVSDGDALELVQAPQGGHFAFISARFYGASGSDIRLTVRVLDPETELPVAVDQRTGPIAPVVGQPGWWEPNPDARGAIAHIAACPVEDTPLWNRSWWVEVSVTESAFDGFRGVARALVAWHCTDATAPLEALCECECAADWQPGSCFEGG